MTDFTVKDSGLRESFDSGMVRDVQDDKTLYSLVFSGPMLERWAEHLTKGAKKYGKNNWLLASGDAELERFIESAIRHFFQWLRGETDEDHAAAVFFNINGAEYVKLRIDGYVEGSAEDVARLTNIEEAPPIDPASITEEERQAAEARLDEKWDAFLSSIYPDVPPSPSDERQDLTTLAIQQAAEQGYANPGLEAVVRELVAEGKLEPFMRPDGVVLFRAGFLGTTLSDGPAERCDCSPAVYRLVVRDEDGPLDGRMVYGTYSKCHEEWYAFPPGTDPRQGGLVYELRNDQVEVGELVADSIEHLLDTN